MIQQPDPSGEQAKPGPPVLRVLLIDEDVTRAEEVAAGLANDGCKVVGILPNHEGLVARVRAAAADVIVCDMENPSRDAIDSMRMLHRDEPRPVVMFVDHSDPGSIADAMAAGVSAYVIEGLSPHRVRAVIDVAIARFSAHQALLDELSQVRTALSDRKIVERAKGLLMEWRSINEAEAYRSMRRMAMDQGRKLVDVAGFIISSLEKANEKPSPKLPVK